MDILFVLYLIALALIMQVIQQMQIIHQNKKYYKLEKEIFNWNKINSDNLKYIKVKVTPEEKE